MSSQEQFSFFFVAPYLDGVHHICCFNQSEVIIVRKLLSITEDNKQTLIQTLNIDLKCLSNGTNIAGVRARVLWLQISHHKLSGKLRQTTGHVTIGIGQRRHQDGLAAGVRPRRTGVEA